MPKNYSNNRLMRAFLIFTLILIFNVNTFAQPNVNKTDSQGRKTGKWLDYHANGKKRYEGTFREGYEIGTFRYYNGLGQLVSELMYSQKGAYADAKMFYNNGIVKAEGRFHNRKKDGVWKYYSRNPHILMKEESYKDGAKDGSWRIYYTHGQLSSEVIWKDGKRDGSWKEFYENGEPKIEAFFKNGKMDGDYTQYAMGRIVVKEGTYVNGNMDGIWYSYNEKGDLIKKQRYTNGFLQQEAFFKDNKLIKLKNHGLTKFNDGFENAE